MLALAEASQLSAGEPDDSSRHGSEGRDQGVYAPRVEERWKSHPVHRANQHDCRRIRAAAASLVLSSDIAEPGKPRPVLSGVFPGTPTKKEQYILLDNMQATVGSMGIQDGEELQLREAGLDGW